jgi:hypothetical protein
MDPSTGGQSIELFYHKGSSDKIYCLSVEASGGDFVVNFAYGRRGTKLRHGTKTLAPVSLSKAQQIYDGVIAEKTAEGYVPEAGALPLTVTQTKDGQNFVREFVREIQEELWSRNYGHSWGVRDEFTALIRAHPELLNLSVKEASDLILANLSIWSPVLAAKEATAMARYVSPEQVKARSRTRLSLGRPMRRSSSAISTASRSPASSRESGPFSQWVGLWVSSNRRRKRCCAPGKQWSERSRSTSAYQLKAVAARSRFPGQHSPTRGPEAYSDRLLEVLRGTFAVKGEPSPSAIISHEHLLKKLISRITPLRISYKHSGWRFEMNLGSPSPAEVMPANSRARGSMPGARGRRRSSR